MFDSTENLYSFMPPLINQSQDGMDVCNALRTSRGVRTMFVQSERGYSVRHGVYVRDSTNQSIAIAYVRGERHGVYVRFSTNQSTAIAYVTGHTYAVWPIRARRSRILIGAAPCGGLRRPAVPLRRPKKKGSIGTYITTSLTKCL